MSLQARLAFELGLGTASFNTFYINPEFRYNFTEAFNGPYVGGYVGLGLPQETLSISQWVV